MTALSPDQSKALDQMIDWCGGLNVTVVHCNGASDCPNFPHTHGSGQPAPVYSLGGLAGCVAGETELWDPVRMKGVRFDELYSQRKRPWVQTLAGPVLADVPFVKGVADLYRVKLLDGRSSLVTADHLLMTSSGWMAAGRVTPGTYVLSGSPTDEQRLSRTGGDFQAGYRHGCRCGDPLLPRGAVADRAFVPSRSGVRVRTHVRSLLGAPASTGERSRPCPDDGRLSMTGSGRPPYGATWDDYLVAAPSIPGAECCFVSGTPGRGGESSPLRSRSQRESRPPQPSPQPSRGDAHTRPENRVCASVSGLSCRGSGACAGKGELTQGLTPSPQPFLSASGHLMPFAGAVRGEVRDSRVSSCSHYWSAWVPVTHISYERTDTYYDLHVPGEEHYLADGMWSHNTGKTTLMRMLDESIDGEAVFGTPTHKAAGVLRRKLAAGQADRVRTMHSLVYQMTPDYRCTVTNWYVSAVNDKCTCKEGEKDGCECPQSFLPCGKGAKHTCHVTMELKSERRKFLAGHRDFVIIDESSMLSNEHVEDLRKFGVPIIVVGDRGQLPPIKAPMNRWTMNPDIELTEIHRQGADSGILQAAHDVRAHGRMTRAEYGAPVDAVRMLRSVAGFNALMDRFTPGVDGALITYTNRLRARLNMVYHDKLVGTAGVSAGDRVVSLGGLPYEVDLVEMDGESFRLLGRMTKIHNGMTGTVRFAKQRSIMTEMAVELDDHPLAKPGAPVVVYTGAVPSAQFGAEKELPFNSPMRPKGSRLWDYAYALTAHKAQGSEYRNVIVADQQPREYRQWMYTAITRAQQGVVVVDWAA